MYEIHNVFNIGTMLVLSLKDLYTNTTLVYGKPYIFNNNLCIKVPLFL